MDYSILKQQILNDIKNDASVKNAVNQFRTKILDKTATYDDAVKFSKTLGNITSSHLTANSIEVSDDTLAEYANELLAPVYRSMQNTALGASKEVQKLFNAKAQLGLNPVEVKNDEERITHIVARYRDAEKFEEVAFLTGKGVAENIARGAVTDTLRANAKAYNDAGFEAYVTRSGSGCCAWCDSMLGTYPVNNVPNDFWRVHKSCTCSFDYKVNNKRTKVTFSTNEQGKLVKNTVVKK